MKFCRKFASPVRTLKRTESDLGEFNHLLLGGLCAKNKILLISWKFELRPKKKIFLFPRHFFIPEI